MVRKREVDKEIGKMKWKERGSEKRPKKNEKEEEKKGKGKIREGREEKKHVPREPMLSNELLYCVFCFVQRITTNLDTSR